MNLEESRQQHACRVGEVRTRTVFNLREIRLADAFSRLAPQSARQFGLAHLAIKPANGALHGAQVANFFSQFHISLIAMYILQFAMPIVNTK